MGGKLERCSKEQSRHCVAIIAQTLHFAIKELPQLFNGTATTFMIARGK
jgi:hypothetical protein